MKKIWFLITVLIFAGCIVSSVYAGSCFSDTIVKRWLEERDRAAERVVQMWARGDLPGVFASQVAVILSNEIYLCSKCREDNDFLKNNLYILNKGSQPTVETVPGILIEQLIGIDLLSPWNQFPNFKRKEVTER